ncbi:MAG: hypothetical protein EA419_00555 [Wenzhouxiangella sp.]|nr:MAG: hypothetical protein EA419_00555 [Wenzhouxiangella sp.]
MSLRTVFGLLFSAVLLSLALPLSASGLPTTSPGENAAKISGIPGQFDQDLHPVRFVEIDGRNIQPREVLWLEPGRYELRVLIETRRGFMPAAAPPGIRRNWERAGPAARREATTIEVEVEAGKTYQIRARYNREERRGIPYSTVLWRVED